MDSNNKHALNSTDARVSGSADTDLWQYAAAVCHWALELEGRVPSSSPSWGRRSHIIAALLCSPKLAPGTIRTSA